MATSLMITMLFALGLFMFTGGIVSSLYGDKKGLWAMILGFVLVFYSMYKVMMAKKKAIQKKR
jgi:uncharacterized membrane protein YoaK (UPF0700 family)